LNGGSPRELCRELEAGIAALREEVARPILPSTDPDGAYRRALQLAQLDRLDEAADLLGSPAAPHALLLLAAVRQAQGRFDESEAAYRRVLAELRPAGRDPAALGLCVRACDGLAFNARARGEPAAAEAVYRAALADRPDPQSRAYFHFQLALH